MPIFCYPLLWLCEAGRQPRDNDAPKPELQHSTSTAHTYHDREATS